MKRNKDNVPRSVEVELTEAAYPADADSSDRWDPIKRTKTYIGTETLSTLVEQERLIARLQTSSHQTVEEPVTRPAFRIPLPLWVQFGIGCAFLSLMLSAATIVALYYGMFPTRMLR